MNDSTDTVWRTDLPGLPAPRRGKVRDLYTVGEHLLIVCCDRISAFDHVLQPGIPGKGKILNQLSNFWLEELSSMVPNHLVATEVEDFPPELHAHSKTLRGRSVLVKQAEVVPFECVARGYLAGSGYAEYRASGTVCGIELPSGLERADRLPQAIFTPATKAASGHDENVPFGHMSRDLGEETAAELRRLALRLYNVGRERAAAAGLILADTKFEFGRVDGRLHLIDEALTPDSSRFWEAETWRPGEEPASYDKQYVRNWLLDVGWDRESPPPELPAEVVAGTLSRYAAAFERLTGRPPVL